MDSNTNTLPLYPLASHRPCPGERGGTLLLALLAIGTLLMIAVNVMQISGSRIATVAQATSWQKAYFLAESGVDIARNALRAASEDKTIWNTQKFPKSDGTTTGWVPSDTSTFPKTADITMPLLDDGGSLVQTIKVVVDVPSGAGTINPSGIGAGSTCYRIRSLGSAELPGPMNISHDPVEINLRKIGWLRDWRSGVATSALTGGPRASRMLEVIVRPVTPFVMAILADEKIEIKKGSGKLVDSWNSKDADSGQRKYLKPDSDKWKGLRDVGNIGANGVNSKNKLIKDAIRLEGSVIWGDVYAAKASQVNIKPTPKLLTDVVKGGNIIDGFYMKLDPVTPASKNPQYSSGVSSVIAVKPDSLKSGPLSLQAGADPANPVKIKFTELHMHAGDKIVIKPAVDSSGNVLPASYINIWVANKMKIHKGGLIELGNGVHANIIVDKCIHLESASKIGGIQYADFDTTGSNGTGKLVADSKTGLPKYSDMTVLQAQSNLKADASQLMLYGGVDKKKRSHIKLSAEFMGGIYAPKYDFKIKFKDGTYKHIYGSMVGHRFKIEGTTQVHYDENMAGQGVATDYQVASVVEDWYDRSAK